jgi:hypothetical protein
VRAVFRLVPSFAAEANRRQKELAGTRPNTMTLLPKNSKVLEVIENRQDNRNEKTAAAQADLCYLGARLVPAFTAEAARPTWPQLPRQGERRPTGARKESTLTTKK